MQCVTIWNYENLWLCQPLSGGVSETYNVTRETLLRFYKKHAIYKTDAKRYFPDQGLARHDVQQKYTSSNARHVVVTPENQEPISSKQRAILWVTRRPRSFFRRYREKRRSVTERSLSKSNLRLR